MEETPLKIVVDGAIGAGKSTLIQHLADGIRARGLKCVVVPEPVGAWEDVGILKRFYDAGSEPDRRADITYIFQTYTFVTRVKATREAYEQNPDADVFILERSIFTDRYVFMELQREMLGPELMKMYEEWWCMWAEAMPFRIDRAVYLKPSISTCQDRVATRAREGEIPGEGEEADADAKGGVSEAYQLRLRKAHEAYLQGMHLGEFPHMPPCPHKNVFVVEGRLADGDFSTPRSPGTRDIVAHILDGVM